MSHLSAAVRRIDAPPRLVFTRRPDGLKAPGRDTVRPGAGQRDVDTADFVRDAAIQAIRDVGTGYATSDGCLT